MLQGVARGRQRGAVLGTPWRCGGEAQILVLLLHGFHKGVASLHWPAMLSLAGRDAGEIYDKFWGFDSPATVNNPLMTGVGSVVSGVRAHNRG